MKGIILAGGKGSRLYPVTKAVCKQLLPVYDKPMVYYPLSTLMLAGIRDILIISTAESLPRFKDLLADGSSLGINITYANQPQPKGIAQSFIIARDFIARDKVCLILGDNIFYGHNFIDVLSKLSKIKTGANILAYYVKDPHKYGVLDFNKEGRVKSVIEKPKKPKTNWVVTGIYFYDNDVVEISKNLRPSKRGELEITAVNNYYLEQGKLNVQFLGRGYAWLDMGTCESLIEASIYIKTIEERQGLKIGCIEEIAYRMKYITAAQLKKLTRDLPENYGLYLKGILKDG